MNRRSERCHSSIDGMADTRQPVDAPPSIEDLILLAEGGDPQAQNSLAGRYFKGDSLERDEEKAAYWLSKSAEQGYPLAMVNLGRMYARGICVAKDDSRAIDLLVGSIGHGVPQAKEIILEDLGLSIVERLAAEGNARAQLFFGICYADGERVEPDSSTAVSWYKTAAAQDEPLAHLMYGVRLLTGDGTQRNLLLAEEQLSRAREAGVLRASEYLVEARRQIAAEIPYLLVKVLDKRWADSLLAGQVFMRALACFSDLTKRDAGTDNEFRGDVLEGVVESFSDGYDHHSFTQDGNGPVRDGMVGRIDALTLRRKVFSLASLQYDPERCRFVKPDPRLESFGDTAVVITDAGEFLRRVQSALSVSYGDTYWWSYDRVAYNVSLARELTYNEFSKSDAYAWQREFRISLDLSAGRFSPEILRRTTDYAKLTCPGAMKEDTRPDSVADSLILQIGDMRDIAVEMPVRQLLELDHELFTNGTVVPSQLSSLRTPQDPRPTVFGWLCAIPVTGGHCVLGVSEDFMYGGYA